MAACLDRGGGGGDGDEADSEVLRLAVVAVCCLSRNDSGRRALLGCDAIVPRLEVLASRKRPHEPAVAGGGFRQELASDRLGRQAAEALVNLETG